MKFLAVSLLCIILTAGCSFFLGHHYPGVSGTVAFPMVFANTGSIIFPDTEVAQCYRTRHGVTVYRTDESVCPDKSEIQNVFTQYDRENKIEPAMWEGIILIATSKKIDCGGMLTLGCADRAGIIMFTLEGRGWSGKPTAWSETIKHELVHMDAFLATKVRQ